MSTTNAVTGVMPMVNAGELEDGQAPPANPPGLRPALAEHLGAAFRVAYGYFGNEQDAADAVQDAYVELLRAKPPPQPVRSLRAWICASVLNACHKRRRREQRLKQREREFSRQSHPDPADGAASDEVLRDVVRGCALGLPDRYRLPLMLHYWESCSVEEIATALGRSPAAVRKQLQRGLERLRRGVERRSPRLAVSAIPALLAGSHVPSPPATLVAAVPVLPAATAPAASAVSLAAIATGKLATVLAGLALMLSAWWMSWAGFIGPHPAPGGADHDPSKTVPASAPGAEAWGEGVRVLGDGLLQAPWPVRSVAFSPDGRHLAVGCEPGNDKPGGIVIWDLASRREVRRIPCLGAVSDLGYSPPGTRLYALLMVDQGERDRLIAWDLISDAPAFAIPVPNNFGPLAFSPERGAVVAVNGPRIDLNAAQTPGVLASLLGEKHTPFYDHRREDVMAWSLGDGSLLRTWSGVAHTEQKRRWSVQHLAVSADGRFLAGIVDCTQASGEASLVKDPYLTIRAWDTGAELQRWRIADTGFGWGSALTWLPDGELLMTSSRTGTRLRQAADGAVVRDFPGNGVLTADGKRVICLLEDKVEIHETASARLIDRWAIALPRFDSLRGIRLSADGRWLAAANGTHTPLLIDLQRHELVAPVADSFASRPLIRHTADGRLGASDGATISFFGEGGDHLRTLNLGWWHRSVDDGGLADQAWSPDGRLAAIPSEGGAQLWDTVMGRRLATCAGHRDKYLEETFLSPDLRYAASCGQYDGTLKIHRLADGQVVQQIRGPDLDFFGSSLHLAGLFWDVARDRILLGDDNARWNHATTELKRASSFGGADVTGIIDLASGQRLHRFVDGGGRPALAARLLACDHGLVYGAASFSTKQVSSNRVALAGEEFCLWRVEDGSFVRPMPDVGKAPVFSADGDRVIGSAGVAEVATGILVRRFSAEWRLSPSRSLAVALDPDLRLTLIDVATGQPIWRQRLLRADARATLAALDWSPREDRLALTIEESAAVMQVELFRQAPAVDGLTSESAVLLLGNAEIEQRMRGLQRLVQEGAAAVPLLERQLAAPVPARTMAVIALERLARAGQPAADAVLAQAAGETAAGARGRLARARRSADLRRAQEGAEPIDWGWTKGHEAGAPPPPEVPTEKPNF